MTPLEARARPLFQSLFPPQEDGRNTGGGDGEVLAERNERVRKNPVGSPTVPAAACFRLRSLRSTAEPVLPKRTKGDEKSFRSHQGSARAHPQNTCLPTPPFFAPFRSFRLKNLPAPNELSAPRRRRTRPLSQLLPTLTPLFRPLSFLSAKTLPSFRPLSASMKVDGRHGMRAVEHEPV